MIRRITAFGLVVLLCTIKADAGPLDEIYEESDVADVAAKYERGWSNNFDNVFRPLLTAKERERLDKVRFRMSTRVRDSEPFGFMAGGDTVIASAASLRFLEDIAMAHTWLDVKGYSTQALGDYLLMLRSWDSARGRPPKPWPALGIPADAFDDEEVARRARRAFDTAAVFVLLHEYGHVFHRHPGNQRVTADVSRANEAAADQFAFDLIVRAGDMPVGVPILFFTMAHLHENRADFATEEEYRRTLAARTHPVSPERLQSLARHMSTWASTYSRNAKPGSQGQVLALALGISELALLVADPGVQALAGRIGKTVRPEDLAPRRKGRHLAAVGGGTTPSGSFHGSFHGQITGGETPLSLDMILRREGNTVTGAYSFGAGFGRIRGTLSGNTLEYEWTMEPDSGRGILVQTDGSYRGTWGVGAASASQGELILRAE